MPKKKKGTPQKKKTGPQGEGPSTMPPPTMAIPPVPKLTKDKEQKVADAVAGEIGEDEGMVLCTYLEQDLAAHFIFKKATAIPEVKARLAKEIGKLAGLAPDRISVMIRDCATFGEYLATFSPLKKPICQATTGFGDGLLAKIEAASNIADEESKKLKKEAALSKKDALSKKEVEYQKIRKTMEDTLSEKEAEIKTAGKKEVEYQKSKKTIEDTLSEKEVEIKAAGKKIVEMESSSATTIKAVQQSLNDITGKLADQQRDIAILTTENSTLKTMVHTLTLDLADHQ